MNGALIIDFWQRGAGLEYIGKYEVQDTLGAGAHGVVLKAYDPILDRIVALKSLKPQRGSDDQVKTILREARLLARLSHPGIVTLFECLEHDGMIFLVMEYVSGRPLSERLLHGPLAVDKAIKVMTELSDALMMAHGQGVYHGDIKPANIMLGEDGRSRLIDFGLAKLSGHDDILATATSQTEVSDYLTGTLLYLSPERISGHSVDAQTDVFALGAVFYEMLTGRSPFGAENLSDALHSILNVAPPRLVNSNSEVSTWIEDLIFSMLHKDRRFRVASMVAVSAKLEARDQRNWRQEARQYANMFLRSLGRQKQTWLWLKSIIVIASVCFGLWATSIVRSNVAPTVSMRIERGLELVQGFAEKGAVEEAQKTFEDILAESSDHSAARAGLALALIREYTSQETDPATLRRAVATAQSAYDADPHLALAHIAMAWTAEFQRDFEKAHQFYDSADILHSDHPLVFEGRSRTLKKQGDVEAALLLMQRAIEVHPEDVVLLTTLGELLSRRGNFSEAEAVLEKAIRLAVDNPISYAQLAHAQHMQDRTNEAVKTIQAGLLIEGRSELYNNLGTYLFFLGLYDQAAQAFERTLEFEGNAHKYLYWANLGDAYRFMPGKSAEARFAHRRAITLLESELANRRDHPALNSRLALYQAKAGNHDLAVTALQYVFTQETIPAVQLYRATITYEIVEDRTKALEMLERAIRSGYPLSEIQGDPELRELRQDRGYAKLVLMESEND